MSYKEKPCAACGQIFIPVSGAQRFCKTDDCQEWRRILNKRTSDHEGSVYALIDPRSRLVRYVGITTMTLDDRLKFHLGERSSHPTHKLNWLAKLRKMGLRPIVVLLETIDISTEEDRLFAREVDWIAFMRLLGCQLVNGNDGGRGGQRGRSGPRTPHTEDRKQKQREITLQQWQDPEYVAKQMESRSKRKGISPPNKGVSPTEETRRKLSEAQSKLWADDEYRQMMHETRMAARPTHCNRGHEFTEENTHVLANGERRCRACARENYHIRKNTAA